MQNKIKDSSLIHILIIIVIGYFLFFLKLGSQDFDYAEAREGQVVLEMHKTGNVILPLRAGTIIPSKPPFFHWLGLIVSRATGSVNEFSIRFPSALFGTLCLIVTYFIGKESFNKRAGFLSSLFLATTTSYLKLSREARVDMTLCFFIVLSILFFILGYKNETRRNLYFVLYFVSSAFATLAKGPVGIVLPSIISLIFLIIRKELKMILRKEILIGILIFTVISFSWYVLAIQKGGKEFFQKQIIKENINRFAGGEGGYGHVHPFYFLLPRSLSFTLPWSIFLPLVICNIYLKVLRKKQKQIFSETEELKGSVNDGKGEFLHKNSFFLIWFLSVLIFFSISASKRTAYLLPLIPAGTILIAVFWDDFLSWEGEKWLKKVVKVFFFFLTIATILASLTIIIAIILYCFNITIPSLLQGQLETRKLRQISFYFSIFYKDINFDLIFSGFSLLWAIYTLWLIKKKGLLKTLYSLIAFILIVTNVICLKYHPVMWGDLFVKDFAIEINQFLRKNDKLYFYNLKENMDLKHNIYNGIIFYTSRHIEDLTYEDISKLKQDELPVYLIAQKKYVNPLIKKGFKIIPVKESKLIDFQYRIFLLKLTET